jgi:hypothetical protein
MLVRGVFVSRFVANEVAWFVSWVRHRPSSLLPFCLCCDGRGADTSKSYAMWEKKKKEAPNLLSINS